MENRIPNINLEGLARYHKNIDEKKMDKVNPRGSGNFGLNLNEDQELGDYAVSLGKGRTFIDIDFSTATVTYDSDDGNYAILNTNLVIPEIDNLVVDYIEFYVGGVPNKCFSPVITDGKLRAYKYYGRDYTTLNNTPISDVKAYIPSGNVATGKYAFAAGKDTEASGYASVAIGEGSMATNRDAIAIGGSNESSGESATTIGYANKAEGYATTAIGYGNEASYNYSVAIGNANNTTATAAVAMGAENTASNAYAVATGYQTTASGWASNSEGRGTVASGQCSHAEGDRSVASGSNSHAEGYMCEAKGQDHAEGMYTIARGNGQHVEGMANIEDTEEKYLHIIGNGTDPDNRSNAMTVDRQGNTWTAGNYTFGDNKVVGEEHEIKLVEDYWGAEPEFEDWTNYLTYGREESGATKVSGDAITGTAIYDVPEGWISGVTYVIDDQSIIDSLAGKTIEIGAIGYDYTFVKDNKVTFRYRYSDSYDFFYQHTDNVNSGSEIISDNVSGLAMRVTVPDDKPINYLQFYFVSNTHNPVQTPGTLELTKAYVIDINEYELPERDNTYIKMKCINEVEPTELDSNTLHFNKADNKMYFTNNMGEAVVFGGNGGAGVTETTLEDYLAHKEEYDASDNFIAITDADPAEAIVVSYDNTDSGLEATNVQDAIDELAEGTSAPEIAIQTTEPTGEEVLWINPDDPHDSVQVKIESLADVDLTNLQDGQILKYDADNEVWVNSTGGGGGDNIHVYDGEIESKKNETIIGTWYAWVMVSPEPFGAAIFSLTEQITTSSELYMGNPISGEKIPLPSEMMAFMTTDGLTYIEFNMGEEILRLERNSEFDEIEKEITYENNLVLNLTNDEDININLDNKITNPKINGKFIMNFNEEIDKESDLGEYSFSEGCSIDTDYQEFTETDFTVSYKSQTSATVTFTTDLVKPAGYEDYEFGEELVILVNYEGEDIEGDFYIISFSDNEFILEKPYYGPDDDFYPTIINAPIVYYALHKDNFSCNKAIGNYSHAEGLGTIALGEAQHVMGKYNYPYEDCAFAIGDGDNDNDRMNIVEIDWDGDIYTCGDINTGGYVNGFRMRQMTLEQYENLSYKDSRTLYIIVEE